MLFSSDIVIIINRISVGQFLKLFVFFNNVFFPHCVNMNQSELKTNWLMNDVY